MKLVKRGEIYFAYLSPAAGSGQNGVRPVLVLQNNTGNQHSPTTIVAAVTNFIYFRQDTLRHSVRPQRRPIRL